jgi:hypothetical protein
MIFKKFIDYILEGSKVDPKKKDIEDVQPQFKDSDPSVPLVCPKCGESLPVCACYTDDYYSAKTPQYTPKGKILKTKTNEKTK